MRRRHEQNLSVEQVHYIRTCGKHYRVIAAELDVHEATIRKARSGKTFSNHPTPPFRPRRGGWKKAQPPAPFHPEKFSLPGEEWRAAGGWERYYRVSNMGRVYSLHQTGRLVVGMRVNGKYRVLKVRDKQRRANLPVHCMVLEAFIGPRPSLGHEGCHNNGKPGDNRLFNLRWDTAKANAADRVIHGTSMRGKSMTRILTPDLVRQIRTAGKTDSYWMIKLRTTRGTIHSARTGKTWQEIETPPDVRPRVRMGRDASTVSGDA